jgi:hypothetical protein
MDTIVVTSAPPSLAAMKSKQLGPGGAGLVAPCE